MILKLLRGSLSGGTWDQGIVTILISSESKAGLDALLAEVLAAGKQATAKAVMDRLVKKGYWGEGLPAVAHQGFQM